MTPRRIILAAAAFLVAICGVIPAAWAHDYLVSSNPKPNGTVTTAPSRITLTFDDIVLDKPARPQITVQGPDGRYYETGCGAVLDREITTPVALGPTGKYTVTWRIVSADGHPVSDSISFTYAGKAAGANGIAAPKACLEAGAAQPARSNPSNPSSSNGGVPTAAIVAVVAIALIGVGGSAYLLLTRERGERPDDTEDLDDAE